MSQMRDYNVGGLKQGDPTANQDRIPNFRKGGSLYLVRCFACGGERGRENHIGYVARGTCAWCGWVEKPKEKSKKKGGGGK